PAPATGPLPPPAGRQPRSAGSVFPFLKCSPPPSHRLRRPCRPPYAARPCDRRPMRNARTAAGWKYPPAFPERPMTHTDLHCLLAVLCLAVAPALHAGQPADDDATRARAVVEDLMRIPGPDGIQESYAERIGGIDQWISIRGQDRDNPVILFVHGGPATPTIPSLWQFQRPLEDYFTMVN